MKPNLYRAQFWWALPMVLAVLAVLVWYQVGYTANAAYAAGLPEPEIPEKTRLLVVAPHSDDEVLNTAVLMKRVLEKNGSVHVVLMTCGDGFTRAVRMETGKGKPGPADYLEFGLLRQSETVNGLSILGLGSGDITFLGYPDSGLRSMWLAHWDEPYTARQSGSASSPYGNTKTPYAPNTGASAANDLMTVIEEFQPTVMVVPDPHDAHPDHETTYAFAQYALAASGRMDIPVWTALTHAGRLWPVPIPPYAGPNLLPPRGLRGQMWYKMPITADEKQTKRLALEAYITQMRVGRLYLNSFMRDNELYGMNSIIFAASNEQPDRQTATMISAGKMGKVFAQRVQDRLHIWMEPNRPKYTYNLEFTVLGEEKPAAIRWEQGIWVSDQQELFFHQADREMLHFSVPSKDYFMVRVEVVYKNKATHTIRQIISTLEEENA